MFSAISDPLKPQNYLFSSSLVCDDGAYSDEYDDTYDSDGVAPPDPVEERRPEVVPRALLTGKKEKVSVVCCVYSLDL